MCGTIGPGSGVVPPELPLPVMASRAGGSGIALGVGDGCRRADQARLDHFAFAITATRPPPASRIWHSASSVHGLRRELPRLSRGPSSAALHVRHEVAGGGHNAKVHIFSSTT